MSGTSPVRPSPWYYLLAAPCFLIGAGLFLYSLLHGIQHATDSLTQVVVPGEAELSLRHGRAYTVFLEERSVVNGKIYSTDEPVNGLQCNVKPLHGEEEIPIHRPSMSTTYDVGGRSGRSVLEFRVPEDGTYKFACAYAEGASGPETVLAVGSGVGGRIFGTVFGSLAAMFGGIGSAGIVILLVFLLRERSKKRLASIPPMHT
jgi:hypothetical protein